MKFVLLTICRLHTAAIALCPSLRSGTVFLSLFFLLFCNTLKAQSVFSFYGPAEISDQRDVHGEGMGGTGVGDLFRPNTSLLNPALSTTIDRVHFATALSMGYVSYRDSEGHSFRDDQIFLPYFNMIFPVRQHRFGINFQDISSGRLATEKEITKEIGEDLVDTIEVQGIDFTLFKIGVLYAHQNSIVNFGVGVNYIFGNNFRSYRQYRIADMSSDTFEKEHTFKSPNITLGIAKSHENLSAGVAFSFPADLKGARYFQTNTLYELIEKNDIYEYPAQLAIGLTYKAHERVFVSTDLDMEFWGETNNFDNPVNTLKAGVGVSFDGDSSSRNFFARMPLRAGVSYRNLPFEINESLVNEMAYHIGFSFPLKQYDSYLMCAVKYYTRGDASVHENEESGFLFTIGTQGFDFFRRPADRRAPRDIPTPDRRF